MSIIFKAFIVDLPGTASETIQDVTTAVMITQCRIKKTARNKPGTATIKLTLAPGESYTIRELNEFWCGAWDTATSTFVTAWYGGFITRIKGDVAGMEHQLELEVSDYNLHLDTTNIYGWPVYNSATLGYPAGHDVADWLIGTAAGSGTGYDGLVRFGLKDIDYSGCPNPFGVVLTDASRPHTSYTTLGNFGYTSLRKVLEIMADVTTHVNNATSPAFFLIATPDGARLRPKFCFVDMAKTTGITPVATFNTTPTTGQFLIRDPAYHERDAKNVRTEIPVKGVGGDSYSGPLAAYVATNAAHLALYPAPHKRSQYGSGGPPVPGWANAPIEESKLRSSAEAQDYAVRVEAILGVPRGTIVFETTEVELYPGDMVRYIDQFEAIDAIFPVREVDMDLSTPNTPKYTVTIGHRLYDLKDIIVRGSPENPVITGDASGSGGNTLGGGDSSGSGASAGGAVSAPPGPPDVAMVANPGFSNRNILQAVYQSVTGLWIKATTRTDTATPPTPAADLFLVTDEPGTTRYFAVDKYGVAGPSDYPFQFLANETQRQVLARRVTFRAVVTSGTGAVAYAVKHAGTLTTVTLPFEALAGDELQVTSSAVSGYYLVTLVTGAPL